MPLNLVRPESVGLSAARLTRLVAVFEAQVACGRLPGAVVVVGRHGGVALHHSLGWRDAASRAAMPLDALFRIYSMTKPLVSVAAMMLLEEGRLLLSDPLSRHCPVFAALQVAQIEGEALSLVPLQRPITVLDLLRHTAGFTYEFLGNGPVHRQLASLRASARRMDLAAFCDHLAQVPLLVQPGTAFEYSRATDVLGRVIEVVSGQPLAEFLQQRLFDPLGLQDSGFAVEAAQHHRIAEPLARDPDGGLQMRVIDVREPAVLASGGGGLVSSARDYARFCQFLLNRGELDGQRLLGPRTLDFMLQDHLDGLPLASAGSRALLPAGHGFGLGLAVQTRSGGMAAPGSVGTCFWGGLAGTSFFIDPALGLYAVLMLQAPNQREEYRILLRNLVYAAVLD